MQKTIHQETLSDGSAVYNLIISDPESKMELCLHCVDPYAVLELSRALSTLTVDFIDQGGMNARFLEKPDQLKWIVKQTGSFNTGRMYAADGQPIDWEINGDNVKFWDRARGINGTFKIVDHKIRPVNDLSGYAQKIIMEHYDAGKYENFVS